MTKILGFVFLSTTLLLSACSNKAVEICKQPGERISINNKDIIVKNACTQEDSAKGLMYVDHLPPNTGMFFVFDKEQTLKFWMKNTLIPLDIAYINKDFIIVDIHTMLPNDETIISSKEPAQYALEVEANYFSQNNIKIGDKVIINLPKE